MIRGRAPLGRGVPTMRLRRAGAEVQAEAGFQDLLYRAACSYR